MRWDKNNIDRAMGPPRQKSLFDNPEMENENDESASKSIAYRRKLKVGGGYFLQFDQLSRVLSAIWQLRDADKIGQRFLAEETGLPKRHIESLISMASALNLIRPGVQLPTPVGALLAEYDIFFSKTGTLEWCHYKGAGSFYNLVWFDVFNEMLSNDEPLTFEQLTDRFRDVLFGKYSDRTIRKALKEEVHFVVNAYLEQRLSQLTMLEEHKDGTLRRRRHMQIDHLIVAAMLYDFIEDHEGRTFELENLAQMPGSPARVFGIDTDSLRGLVEALHNNGWLRYETTHNLDQVRLKPQYGTAEFLTAYYKQREPISNDRGGGGRG